VSIFASFSTYTELAQSKFLAGYCILNKISHACHLRSEHIGMVVMSSIPNFIILCFTLFSVSLVETNADEKRHLFNEVYPCRSIDMKTLLTKLHVQHSHRSDAARHRHSFQGGGGSSSRTFYHRQYFFPKRNILLGTKDRVFPICHNAV